MSTDSTSVTDAPGRALRRTSTMAEASINAGLRAHPLLIDLALELNDAVDQRLWTRRTARHEDVNRHNLLDALHDGVVVEHTATAGAGAHRNNPLGFGHLV